MRIAKTDLDEWDISALHVEQDGAEPWTFVPMWEDRVQAIDRLGDEFLLIRGSTHLAVWRVPDRSPVAEWKLRGYPYLQPWSYASARQSLFVLQGGGEVTELSLATGESHRHPLDVRQVHTVGAIDGGRRIALTFPTGPFESSRADLLILDPATGQQTIVPLPRPIRSRFEKKQTQLSAFSPDGHLVARVHLGSVAYAPAGRGRSLFGLGQPSFANHPDLRANPGQDCYGVAAEVYETGTGQLSHRLLAAFLTAAEYQELVQRNGSWREPGQLAMLEYAADDARKEGVALTPERLARTWLKPGKPLFRSIIERMAERFPYDRWDGERQVVYGGANGLAASKAERDFIDFPFRFLTDVQLAWHDDRALTVTWPNGRERDVHLDGRVTPWREAPPSIRALQVPEAALKALRTAVRDKACITIKLADLDLAGCRAALDEMAARMTAGLPDLVFRDVLDWRFQHGRQRLNERKFFDHLRTFSPAEQATLIPPLRTLLRSFGEQARVHRPRSHDMFLSGVGAKQPETWKAALSDAALFLAETDRGAGLFLRGWLGAVDQEHDQTAAGKVLPAFARCTGWRDESALGFGLFYVLQQWQTPRVPLDRLGIIEAARAGATPERFVRMVEEERVAVRDAGTAHGEPLPPRLNVRALLGDAIWDQEVAALLPADA